MKRISIAACVALLAGAFALPASAQEPECKITIPGNTSYGMNRSYSCAERIFNSIEIYSDVYGLISQNYDRLYIKEDLTVEEALSIHLDRVSQLAPVKAYSDAPSLGLEVCFAFDPVVRFNDSSFSNDYQDFYRENTKWKEFFSKTKGSQYGCDDNSGMTSGQFYYQKTYKCPPDGYMMKSYYNITDPSVPYCLKPI